MAPSPTLRDCLLKAEFPWVDDFWGRYEWDVFERQIRKALPSGSYPIQELSLDHPIFNMGFMVPRVPQIPSINYWFGSGGGTSARGLESAVPHMRAIVDGRERILVITHNTDRRLLGERSENREYFVRFSVDGYALGISVLVYTMTH